jgi:hypothetical protein
VLTLAEIWHNIHVTYKTGESSLGGRIYIHVIYFDIVSVKRPWVTHFIGIAQGFSSNNSCLRVPALALHLVSSRIELVEVRRSNQLLVWVYNVMDLVD